MMRPVSYKIITFPWRCRFCHTAGHGCQTFTVFQNLNSKGYTFTPTNILRWNLPVTREERPIEQIPFCLNCGSPDLSHLPDVADSDNLTSVAPEPPPSTKHPIRRTTTTITEEFD